MIEQSAKPRSLIEQADIARVASRPGHGVLAISGARGHAREHVHGAAETARAVLGTPFAWPRANRRDDRRQLKETKMFANRKFMLLSLGAALWLTSLASADGLGITIGKYGRHTSFGLQFSSAPICEPPPPPHVIAFAPAVWVRGHYEIAIQNVWVEGARNQVWCPPVFEWRRDACGRLFKVAIRPGHWDIASSPGHNEVRRVEVWQAGHWQVDGAGTL
jgi:hypothetical protein